MANLLAAIRTQIARQIAHWVAATEALQRLEDLAAPAAWNSLERYLGVALRKNLVQAVERLKRQAAALQASFEAAQNAVELERVRTQLLSFRRQYLRTETTLEFYADAVNTRTSPEIAALLRACDTLAHRSMAQLLDQLGKPTPVVLTYLDQGLGASILKAGLRLWDGSTESPAAAIKIVRHNLQRPTALIHEAGHQVAHVLGWNNELSTKLKKNLSEAAAGIAETWASWASEIAADAFAFVHTGYAAVAALHDVLAGEEPFVFRYALGDPHPVSYLRVLLGIEMCRDFYGAGPWDDMALAWKEQHPLERAGSRTRSLLRNSLSVLPRVVELSLNTPMKAFGGRALSTRIDPERVKPQTLQALERQLGIALYSSMHWVWTESLRLLALTGFKVATMPQQAVETIGQQQKWMLRLGDALLAA